MALRTALVQAVPRGLWIVMCVLALGASMAEGCGDNTGAGGSDGAGGMPGAGGAGGTGGAPMCEGPSDCNDENPCTENWCDLAQGTCSNPTFTNGTICSGDGNPGKCVAGVCTGLCEFVGCGDRNECTEDVCDPADGSCLNPPASDGTVCDAGGDSRQCSTGLCVGLCALADCDDGNECTEDLCNRADGSCNSLNRPDGSDCELGGSPGRCMSGTCMDSALCREVDCGDGNECTDDVCNPTTAVCANPDKVDGAFCETDGNPGLCSTGQCRGLCEIVSCDDGNQCTISLCDPSNGSCPNPDAPNGTLCDYGDLPGRCSAGLCVGLCAGVVCNDHNQCTSDVCNPRNGVCAHDPVADGISCDVGGDTGVCDAGACRERRWGTPVLVERNDAGSAGWVALAADPSGNVTAVWSQDDGTGNRNIWSNRYPVGGRWGTPVLVETDDDGSVGCPRLGVDASGNLTALWHRDDGTGTWSIWSNRHPVGGRWGTPVLVATDDEGSADCARLGVDASGNATAAWAREDSSIWSNRYEIGGSWGTAVHLNPGQRGLSEYPALAVDRDGNVTVVWGQFYGGEGPSDVYSARYPVGGPWGTPITIGDPTRLGARNATAVVADPAGNVTAVWTCCFNGPGRAVWSNRYPVGGPWGTPVVVTHPGVGAAMTLAVDLAGNVTMVGTGGVFGAGAASPKPFAARYPAGGPWGTAAGIYSDPPLGSSFSLSLAVDPSGNATLAWYLSSVGVYWSRSLAGGAWATPEVFVNAVLGEDSFAVPKMVADSSGNVTAVWSQQVSPEGRRDIWSSRFE